jgi:hypothetical protein
MVLLADPKNVVRLEESAEQLDRGNLYRGRDELSPEFLNQLFPRFPDLCGKLVVRPGAEVSLERIIATGGTGHLEADEITEFSQVLFAALVKTEKVRTVLKIELAVPPPGRFGVLFLIGARNANWGTFIHPFRRNFKQLESFADLGVI